MGLNVDPVEVKFLADMSQLKRDMEEMKNVVANGVKQSTERAAAETASGINSLLSGITTRLAGIASLAGLQQTFSAIHAATLEAEKSQILLSGALKATGHAAGLTKGEIEGLVEQLAASTTFDDESIRSAAAALLRFRDIQGETFRETLKLAPDLAAALGTDLVEATRQLGKAILDPASGMRSLKAAGVALSETQADAAQKMRETGNAAGAARIVLDQLRTTVGGQSAEANQGLVGGTAALKKAWGEMLEAIGQTESYQASSNFLIDGLTQKIKLLQQVVEGGKGSIGNFFAELIGGQPYIDAMARKAARENESRAAAEEEEKRRALAGAARRDEERNEEARALAAKKAAEAGKKQTEEYQALIKSIREKTAVNAAEIAQGEQITEGQRLAAKLMADLRDGTLKLTEARKIALAQELESLIASDKAVLVRKEFLKQMEEERKAENDRIQAQFKAVDALDDEIKKQKEHNEEIGLTVEQLNALKLARMDDAVAIRERQLAQEIAAKGDDAYTEALRIQITQLRELRNLTASSQVKQVGADAAKKAEEEWKRTSENIERNLTDALMRGFEGGKDAAQNFRDTLKNMFKTLVLQPLLKPLVEPVARTMSGIGQALSDALLRNMRGSGTGLDFGGTPSGALDFFVPSAHGNVFTAPSLSALSGQVLDRPTIIPFARGGALAGEAGPEAIMPLRRGRDGRLGVDTSGGGVTNNVSIVVNTDGASRVQGDSANANELGRRLDAGVRSVLLREMQPGGLLSGAAG